MTRIAEHSEDADREPSPGDSTGLAAAPKSSQAWAGISRKLSETDIVNNLPAVKLLLDRLDCLERENAGKEDLARRYHDVDKDCAVLREKQRKYMWAEAVSYLSISVGSAGLGLFLGPKGTDAATSGSVALVAILASAILLLGGIVVRLCAPR